jgi:hypothetical protein
MVLTLGHGKKKAVNDLNVLPLNVKEAINKLKDGAKSGGTNPGMLRNGISKLKTKDDFDKMETFMKNNPLYMALGDGYSSLQELLRGELEGDNFFTAEQIANNLACIGVVMSYVVDSRYTSAKMLLDPSVNINVPDNSKGGPNTIFGSCSSTPVSSTTTMKQSTGGIKIYPGDNTWEYKVEGDHWLAKRKGTEKWYNLTGDKYNKKFQSTINKLDNLFPDERKDKTPKREISIAQAWRNPSK